MTEQYDDIEELDSLRAGLASLRILSGTPTPVRRVRAELLRAGLIVRYQ